MTTDISHRLREFAAICDDMRPVGQWPGDKAIALLTEAATALEAAPEAVAFQCPNCEMVNLHRCLNCGYPPPEPTT